VDEILPTTVGSCAIIGADSFSVVVAACPIDAVTVDVCAACVGLLSA